MRTKEAILSSLIQIAVTFYCLGILFFLIFANFAPLGLYNKWNWLYYWWEKIFGSGIVVWLVVWFNCSSKDRNIVAPVIFFSFIRIVWDIVSFFFGVHINAPVPIAILFIIMIAICYVLTLSKDNFANKWLTRILL